MFTGVGVCFSLSVIDRKFTQLCVDLNAEAGTLTSYIMTDTVRRPAGEHRGAFSSCRARDFVQEVELVDQLRDY